MGKPQSPRSFAATISSRCSSSLLRVLHAADGDVRAHARRDAQSTDSIELWTSLIGDLFAMRCIRQVGLLLHNYSGDVNTEAFEVTRASARFDHFVARLLEIQDGELLMAFIL